MSRKVWKLNPDTTVDGLRDQLDELRADYDDMSERWQESDKGYAVAEWLDEVESVCEDYDSAVAAFDDLAKEY